MLDDRERLDILREELDVELQTTELAQAQLAPVAGSDASGTITVRLDAEGVVTSVLSDGAWRQHLDPAALPAAVLEAYTAAISAREQDYVAAFGNAEPTRARPSGEREGRFSDEVLDKMRERSEALPPSMLAALGEMLDDLDKGVDQAFSMVDQQLATDVDGRSSSGHAFARLSGGGELVSVSYDQRWLGTAHAFNVGRETTEAIHDALRQHAGRGVDAIAEASGLARLQHLTRDPEALARHLGL